jgi:hypothetical protein
MDCLAKKAEAKSGLALPSLPPAKAESGCGRFETRRPNVSLFRLSTGTLQEARPRIEGFENAGAKLMKR